MTFSGFPDEALVFYEGLEADNSRPYWTDNRDRYETFVREPMLALLAELEPEFGPSTMFRPYRDVRFSRNKAPYKEHAGAVVRDASGMTAFYVQVSAAGLRVAAGCYSTESDQIERYRRAVADDVRGERLRAMVDHLRAAGYQILGDRLKTRPRGYGPDHPRLDLLRHRTLYAACSFEPEPWLHTAECADRVRAAWRDMAPLSAWLVASVGPTTVPR